MSLSVPVAVLAPTESVEATLTPPEDETLTGEPVDWTKVTEPIAPLVSSWSVKLVLSAGVTVAALCVGELWAIVTGFTVKV
jgi:hypothetical protein